MVFSYTFSFFVVILTTLFGSFDFTCQITILVFFKTYILFFVFFKTFITRVFFKILVFLFLKLTLFFNFLPFLKVLILTFHRLQLRTSQFRLLLLRFLCPKTIKICLSFLWRKPSFSPLQWKCLRPFRSVVIYTKHNITPFGPMFSNAENGTRTFSAKASSWILWTEFYLQLTTKRTISVPVPSLPSFGIPWTLWHHPVSLITSWLSPLVSTL